MAGECGPPPYLLHKVPTAMMCMRWSDVATGTDLCNISPASHTFDMLLFGTVETMW